MQRKPVALHELKEKLTATETYKKVQEAKSLRNECSNFTSSLFQEIKDEIQAVRVSVNKGEHWFLLCNTSDKGVVIVDPTYRQIFVDQLNDSQFFVGSREELWGLAKEDDKSLEFFDKNWPTEGRALFPEDLNDSEMKSLLKIDDDNMGLKGTLGFVKVGNKIDPNANLKHDLSSSEITLSTRSKKTSKASKGDKSKQNQHQTTAIFNHSLQDNQNNLKKSEKKARK